MQDEIKKIWYCNIDEACQSPTHDNDVEKLRVAEWEIVNDYYKKEFKYTIEYREEGNYLE